MSNGCTETQPSVAIPLPGEAEAGSAGKQTAKESPGLRCAKGVPALAEVLGQGPFRNWHIGHRSHASENPYAVRQSEIPPNSRMNHFSLIHTNSSLSSEDNMIHNPFSEALTVFGTNEFRVQCYLLFQKRLIRRSGEVGRGGSRLAIPAGLFIAFLHCGRTRTARYTAAVSLARSRGGGPGPPHLNRTDQLLQCPVIRQGPIWKWAAA